MPLIPDSPTALSYGAPLVDFGVLGDLGKTYHEGNQMARTRALQGAFSGGLPKLPDGSLDIKSMTDTLARLGGADAAMPLLNLEMQQQIGQGNYGAVQGADAAVSGGAASPQQPAPVVPRPVAVPPSGIPKGPPVGTTGAATAPAPQGDNGANTLMAVLAENGVPEDKAGFVAGSIAKRLNIDPNAPITDPGMKAKVGRLLMAQGAGVPTVAENGGQTVSPQVPAPDKPAAPQKGMDEATARNYEKAANALRARAAGVAKIDPQGSAALEKQASTYDATAKSIRDFILKDAERTQEQKNYESDMLPGERMAAYQARVAGGKKLSEDDANSYQKKYDGIQKLGAESTVGLHKANLAKSLLNDSGFYSGPLEPTNRLFKQFAATVGADPNKAMPQEALNKVINDMLTEQIRALGGSGVGQVRVAEVNIMKQAIASLGLTPATNRLLVEIVSRNYKDNQELAKIARDYKGAPGRMNPGLDTAINKHLESHPLFTKDELSDPRLIAPPEFKTPEAVMKAQLPKGSPFKDANGKIRYIP